jgi:LmbE family N-acetylglucosaminyl deacetylase
MDAYRHVPHARRSLTAAEPPQHHAIPDRLLIISPHLDDAVLSCWAVLARATPVDVLTVFAGAPVPAVRKSWDIAMGFNDSAESLRVRLSEDAEAFAGTGHKRSHMALLDDQYLDGSRGPQDVEALAARLREWMSEGVGGVAIPAGAGRVCRGPIERIRRVTTRLNRGYVHPDHVFVRQVVLETVPPHSAIELLAYEEVPYTWAGSSEPRLISVARAAGRGVVPLDLPVDRAAKARRIGAYRSQTAGLLVDGRRVDDPATLPAEERYWRLPPLPGGEPSQG